MASDSAHNKPDTQKRNEKQNEATRSGQSLNHVAPRKYESSACEFDSRPDDRPGKKEPDGQSQTTQQKGGATEPGQRTRRGADQLLRYRFYFFCDF